ncbi:DNA-binding transcriptional regulator/RsmH inhibitor MraZ [Rhizobium leguminosarum]
MLNNVGNTHEVLIDRTLRRIFGLQSEVTATGVFDTLGLRQKEKYAYDPHP